MNNYKFYKEWDHRWYIDLPDWTGPKAALEMVAGADTMLDIFAQGESEVNLNLSEMEFEGADSLEFIRIADDISEGAYYMMEDFSGIKYDLEMWLCDVTKFVFGKFPKTIWISKN